jgi:hypothetical protein
MRQHHRFPRHNRCRTKFDPCGLYECLSDNRDLCPYFFVLVGIPCCTHAKNSTLDRQVTGDRDEE